MSTSTDTNSLRVVRSVFILELRPLANALIDQSSLKDWNGRKPLEL